MTQVRVHRPTCPCTRNSWPPMADDIRQAATTLTGRWAASRLLRHGRGRDAFKALYDPALHGAEDAMNTTVVGRLARCPRCSRRCPVDFGRGDAADGSGASTASPGDHFGE